MAAMIHYNEALVTHWNIMTKQPNINTKAISYRDNGKRKGGWPYNDRVTGNTSLTEQELKFDKEKVLYIKK